MKSLRAASLLRLVRTGIGPPRAENGAGATANRLAGVASKV